MLEKFCRPQQIIHSGKLTIHTTYIYVHVQFTWWKCSCQRGEILFSIQQILSSAHITGIPAVVSTSRKGADANKLSRDGAQKRRQQRQQHQQHGGS